MSRILSLGPLAAGVLQLSIAVSPLAAQGDTVSVQALIGREVRGSVPPPRPLRFQGTVLRADSASLFVSSGSRALREISLTALQGVEVRTGAHSALPGATAGFVLGAVLGGVLGKQRLAHGSHFDHSEDAFVAVLGYAPVGGALGALICGFATRPRWTPIVLRR